MTSRVSPSVEIRDACPYCDFKFVVDARSIAGERHALQCIDCRETFVVEVDVAVTHKVRGLAGVSSEAVLDRLAIAHPGKAVSDGPADIPVLTDAVVPGEAAELPTLERVNDDEHPEACDCRACLEATDPTLHELTDAELDELRELMKIAGVEAEEEASSLEYQEPEPIQPCRNCKTRTFCRNANRCSLEHPAEARSGISTRARPPSMASLGKSAPPHVATSGLKYREGR